MRKVKTENVVLRLLRTGGMLNGVQGTDSILNDCFEYLRFIKRLFVLCGFVSRIFNVICKQLCNLYLFYYNILLLLHIMQEMQVNGFLDLRTKFVKSKVTSNTATILRVNLKCKPTYNPILHNSSFTSEKTPKLSKTLHNPSLNRQTHDKGRKVKAQIVNQDPSRP